MNGFMINYYLEKIFFFLIIIEINQIIIKTAIMNLNLDYTHALSLLNGNIFILHKNGIVVYNYNFTIVLYNNDFDGIPIISSEEENNLTSVIQCETDNNNYIVSLINNKTYVFNWKGIFLFKTGNNFFSNFSTNVYYKYYSFLFYKNEGTIYYFIITYKASDEKIKIIKFKIDMINHSSNIDFESTNMDIFSHSVSSQILNSDKYSNILACFYVKNVENNYHLYLSLFDIENEFKLVNETLTISDQFSSTCNYLIKSIIDNKKKTIFVYYIHSNEQTFYWFFFDFDLFYFSSRKGGSSCEIGTTLNKINYFSFINSYILSCKSNSGISIFLIHKDFDNTSLSTIGEEKFESCSTFKNYDIVFLLYERKFILITNFLCDASTTQVNNVSNNFNNAIINYYEIPSNEPDSNYNFSCISTIPKTILTTIPSSIPTTLPTTIPTTILTTIAIITPTTIPTTISTTIPTNIPTIIPTTILTTMPAKIPSTIPTNIPTTIPITILTTIQTTFPTTKITIIPTIIPTNIPTTIPITISTTIPTTILDSSYIRITTTIIEYIKTTIENALTESINCDLKCLTCNEESLLFNLCIECNKNEEYYPSLQSGQTYVECYNNQTKPHNFYFNKITQSYEPCYSKCKTCLYQGNEEINNCTLCKNNYIFRPDKKIQLIVS